MTLGRFHAQKSSLFIVSRECWKGKFADTRSIPVACESLSHEFSEAFKIIHTQTFPLLLFYFIFLFVVVVVAV